MRRTGKIARLPAAVREQINRRLDDGQKSKIILPWLNALPEVKAVVDAEFEGRLITEHNLSEWNTGGFAAWAEKQRLRESVDSFLEDAASLKAVTEGQLTESMGTMFAATVADQMLRLQTMPEGVEKAKIWKELRISLLALRRGALYARKLSIEEAKHAGRPPREGGDASPRRPWPAGPAIPTIEERRRAIMERIGIDEGFDGSLNPELTLPDPGPDPNVGVSRSGFTS
jgi:hypothetical protein